MPIYAYILALLNEQLVKEKEQLKKWEDKLNDDTIGDYTKLYEPHDIQAGRVEGIELAISLIKGTEGVDYIDDSLDLRGTQITSLPDNLTVWGSLYIRDTQITSLPDNLTVWGSLDLRDTKITSLPDNLKVWGHLYLRGTNIEKIPKHLKDIIIR